jgi:hypothetical protein
VGYGIQPPVTGGQQEARKIASTQRNPAHHGALRQRRVLHKPAEKFLKASSFGRNIKRH